MPTLLEIGTQRNTRTEILLNPDMDISSDMQDAPSSGSHNSKMKWHSLRLNRNAQGCRMRCEMRSPS